MRDLHSSHTLLKLIWIWEWFCEFTDWLSNHCDTLKRRVIPFGPPPGFEKVPSEIWPLVLTKSKATCAFTGGRYLRARKGWVRSEDGLINRTSMIDFNQNCPLVSPSGRQLPDVVCFIATQKSVWSNLIGHVTYLKLSCSRVIGTWESPILGVQRRLRPSVAIPTLRTHTSNSVQRCAPGSTTTWQYYGWLHKCVLNNIWPSPLPPQFAVSCPVYLCSCPIYLWSCTY